MRRIHRPFRTPGRVAARTHNPVDSLRLIHPTRSADRTIDRCDMLLMIDN